MSERMCEYGNCQGTNVAITINCRRQERPAFCCEEHAALWLLRRSTSINAPTFTRLEHDVLQCMETA